MSPARTPSRWWLYGPLIAGAAIFAVYVALWMQGAAAMRRSITAWADDQRAAGIEVQYDSIATRGFPFFLRGAVNEVSIGEAGAWRWQAPRLYVDALPLAPNRLVFSARKGHVIDAAGVGRWRIDAPDGRASIESDDKRLWIVDIESGAGRMENSSGETVSAERFLLTVAPAESDHRTVEASLAIANLLARMANSEIEAPSVEAMIAVRDVAAMEFGAEAWRAAGGGVELRRIFVDAGGAKLTLAGELTVDDAGRPQGVLMVEATNPGALARLLGELGALDKTDADLLEASLTLAAIAGGGKLKTPLVLENGFASVAGVAIAKLPRIVRSVQP